MHAHEMLGGLVVVVGFGKRAKLFLRELDLGFRVDSEGLQETVHAFDLKGTFLRLSGALTGTLSCAKAAEDIVKHASADRRMVVLRVDILCL